MKHILLFTWLAWFFSNLAVGQIISIDPAIPAIPLTDSTKTTLLNSRLGSRFTFNLAAAAPGIHTGALGFDADELSELLVAVESPSASGAPQLYCFRTASLPPGARYLKNQTFRLGMTTLELTGKTDEGLQATVQIISPFTSSNTLEEKSLIKTQTAPVFYINAQVSSASGEAVQGTLRVGLKKLAVNRERQTGLRQWQVGAPGQTVFYRDISGAPTYLALSSLSGENTRHFRQRGFDGLETNFSLKPNQPYQHTWAYAAYHAGEVQYDRMHHQSLRFYYTQFWNSIDEVLQYAQESAPENLARSARFEQLLTRSDITSEEKWVIALTFRNDLANTFLLLDEEDQPRFYVMEGRFLHQSTVDVAHEAEINALFCPWRLKLQLSQWMDYIAWQEVVTGYREREGKRLEVHEGMSAAEYGPFVQHDVGDYPFISKTTDYSFGPHMAVEENATYVLLLYWYWKLTGDDKFVQDKLGLVDVLLQSLINRDTNESGIADVGVGWSTYDVSEALKRSPENVYLGVKQMSAYVAGAEMATQLTIRKPPASSAAQANEGSATVDGQGQGFHTPESMVNVTLREKQAKKYTQEAEKVLRSLEKAHKKYGYVPVSLDQNFQGWDQYSIVLGEGLWYMGLTGNSSPLLRKAAGYLGDTYRQALTNSKTDYGIKLASGENVTWFSKVMVADVVASYWYDSDFSSASYTYRWNKNHPYAYNDGAFSADEDWHGYWYPRGISSLGYILRAQGFTISRRASFLKGL